MEAPLSVSLSAPLSAPGKARECEVRKHDEKMNLFTSRAYQIIHDGQPLDRIPNNVIPFIQQAPSKAQ